MSAGHSQKPHEKIAEVIQGRIASGELKPSRRIPSQLELAKEFSASTRTISLAVALLRDRCYVWTLPHKGSYARPPEHWQETAN